MPTVNRKQLVNTLIQEIMQGVSRQVREIVREEIDIERKRLRKQLLEEFSSAKSDSVNRPPKMTPLIDLKKPTNTPTKRHMPVDTGDNMINEIIRDIKEDEMFFDSGNIPGYSAQPDHSDSFEKASKIAAMNEQRRSGNLWKPPEGEGYNFDPTTMDPAQIDWSSFVDAVEEKTKNRLPQ